MAGLSRVAMLATIGLVAALLAPTAMSGQEPSLISMVTESPSHDLRAESCSDSEVDNMVAAAVRTAINDIDTGVGVVPGLLRIFFHDCFPQGCDASILLTGPNSELNMPQNGGIRQSVLDLIETIRDIVHTECGHTVSCADITALATRQAVMQSGAPGYQVLLGRRDSLEPASQEQVAILPSPDAKAEQLVESFTAHGFTVEDVVALSGAHTIGKASCASFKNRFGENAKFVRQLQMNCTTFPVAPLQDLDVTTPNTFDNKYYTNLQEKKGVLNSDMALTLNATTDVWVNNFAGNEGWFFASFSTAMQKMATLEGPVTIGEVRRNCFKRNLADEA